MVQKR